MYGRVWSPDKRRPDLDVDEVAERALLKRKMEARRRAEALLTAKKIQKKLDSEGCG